MRNILFLMLCFFAGAEFLSWETASWPGPCLVQEQNTGNGNEKANQENCPTFVAGLFLLTDRAVETIKRDDNDKVIVAVFTIVLAFSTIGLWLATIQLWRAGERQQKLAEDTAERELRAYVHVERAQILNFGTGTVRLRIVFKNSGQTPAYRFSHWTNVGGDSIPPKHGFAGPAKSIDIESVLPAGAVNTAFEDYGPLKSSHVTNMLMGQAAIWAWGIITYEDIFGKKRTTKYRMIFRGAKTSPPGGMSFDAEGNEAD